MLSRSAATLALRLDPRPRGVTKLHGSRIQPSSGLGVFTMGRLIRMG